MWECFCHSCGKSCIKKGNNLRNGTLKSCGCMWGQKLDYDADEVVGLAKSGLTTSQICDRLYIDDQKTVWRVLNKRGVKPNRPTPYWNQHIGELVQLWHSGASEGAIAKKFGVTKCAIAGAINRARNAGADLPHRLSPIRRHAA